jgi:cytochrome oxidase assembly protein ShyY1
MNDHWNFVIAAYALTALLTAAVLVQSWRAMRSAEARADALRQERP